MSVFANVTWSLLSAFLVYSRFQVSGQSQAVQLQEENESDPPWQRAPFPFVSFTHRVWGSLTRQPGSLEGRLWVCWEVGKQLNRGGANSGTSRPVDTGSKYRMWNPHQSFDHSSGLHGFSQCTKAEVSKSFSVKSWIVNVLGFLDNTVSIATIQLCYCSTEWVIANICKWWSRLCSDKTLLIKTYGRLDLAKGPQLTEERLGRNCSTFHITKGKTLDICVHTHTHMHTYTHPYLLGRRAGCSPKHSWLGQGPMYWKSLSKPCMDFPVEMLPMELTQN